MATLGTEESGHCREVETREKVRTVHQKNGGCREVALIGGSTVIFLYTLRQIEFRSDDIINMKFVKLWDLLRYSERTTVKTPTHQKLTIRGKLSLRH